MPQALQLPLLCLGVAAGTGAADYASCVREAIRLGGCSASRSLLVGAVAAALDDGCPQAWIEQLAEPDRVVELARKVATLAN